jgi:NAD-dependent deacetylase
MPNLVILTGAGISAESGISTFRDSNGLWENHSIEDVATPQGFGRNPALVHRFYNQRRAQLKTVAPNPAHAALAELEQAWKGRGDFMLITQNVDDLHERAGSHRLRHMHGELRKVKCTACQHVYRHEDDLDENMTCPNCLYTGNLRPDIVWFGEMPYHLDEINHALTKADIYVAIGTSGVVFPAALFGDLTNGNGRGCKLIEVNPNPTDGNLFPIAIVENASTGVPKLAQALLNF